jgi:hypothetical protein
MRKLMKSWGSKIKNAGSEGRRDLDLRSLTCWLYDLAKYLSSQSFHFFTCETAKNSTFHISTINIKQMSQGHQNTIPGDRVDIQMLFYVMIRLRMKKAT